MSITVIQAAASQVLPVAPNSFTPEQFGATGNNAGHDDAPGIEAAINAALTAAVSTQAYTAEVVLDASKVYYALRDPRYLSNINNNAIIGIGNNQANPGAHNQTIALILRTTQPWAVQNHSYNEFGAVPMGGSIYCPHVGYSWDSTNGVPRCLIGGPRAGSGTELPVVLTTAGLTLMQPGAPTLVDLDASGIGGLYVRSLWITSTTNSVSSAPNCVGLYMPTRANFGVNNIDYIDIGWRYAGLYITEHAAISHLGARGNHINLVPSTSGGSIAHGAAILNCDLEEAEGTGYHIAGHSPTTGVLPVADALPISIGLLDFEDTPAPQYHLYDTNNAALIDANYCNASGSPALLISGGLKSKLRYVPAGAGPVTAPGFPATTVAYTNAFGRDALVTITGGSVTVIAVDGTSTGLTSGAILVPSWHTITVTYTGSPAWQWSLIG